MCEFPSLPLARCHVNELLTPYYKNPYTYMHQTKLTLLLHLKIINVTKQHSLNSISGEGLKGF